MQNSKLILLLKTFDSSELRAFKDFVESPYFNKNEDLIQLYHYLKTLAAKGFPANKIQREAVFAAVYPDQFYDERQLNYCISLLLKLAERFIGLRRYEQSGMLPEYQQLFAYVERDLDKNYQYIFQQTLDRVEASPYRNADYYFQRYLLSDVADEHFAKQNIRRYDQNLQDASDFLDVFYIAKKLRYLCNMLDQQKFITADYQLNMLVELKEYLHNNNLEHIPAIHLYHLLLLTLTESEPELFFRTYRQHLREFVWQFPLDEQRALYHFAINFCIHRIRLGAKEFTQDLMNLYQEGVENQVLLEKGQISPWTYKNMVKLGLGLGQYDWVEDFVKKYSEKLEAEKRADAYHFNLADLYYHRKSYGEALEYLNQVEFSDIHYHLGAKVMLLKIYYETQEYEALLSLILAFKNFLRRNKNVPKEVKEPYLNFVNLLHELYKKPINIKDFKEKVNKTAMLSDRSWLLQQINPSGKSEVGSRNI